MGAQAPDEGELGSLPRPRRPVPCRGAACLNGPSRARTCQTAIRILPLQLPCVEGVGLSCLRHFIVRGRSVVGQAFRGCL